MCVVRALGPYTVLVHAICFLLVVSSSGASSLAYSLFIHQVMRVLCHVCDTMPHIHLGPVPVARSCIVLLMFGHEVLHAALLHHKFHGNTHERSVCLLGRTLVYFLYASVCVHPFLYIIDWRLCILPRCEECLCVSAFEYCAFVCICPFIVSACLRLCASVSSVQVSFVMFSMMSRRFVEHAHETFGLHTEGDEMRWLHTRHELGRRGVRMRRSRWEGVNPAGGSMQHAA